MKEIITTFIWCSILTALTVPALHVVKLFKNGTEEFPSGMVILKAALGFISWIILTGGLYMSWLFVGFSQYEAQFSTKSPSLFYPIIACAMSMIYMLIGGGLIYWVWQPEKLELP
ncbi:MAG TPA: hypothetical protein VGC91_16810 [Pyrinomonadaceae bacterium]|jgi:hypothetical protein